MSDKNPAFGRSYFSPDELCAQQPTGARSFRDLIYAAPHGFRPLELDVYVPAGANAPVACVVWIHGGGFAMGSRRHPPLEWPPGAVFQLLIDAGLAVASIDYRHTAEAPFPAQLHDAKAAVRYLRAYAGKLGIDPQRIGVWGESAGGQLAALVGLVHDRVDLEGAEGVVEGSSAVAVVVDFYGASNLETIGDISDRMPPHVRAFFEQMGGPPPDPRHALLAGSPLTDAQAAASPVTYVRADAPPFLIVHGDADFVVPISQSEELTVALEHAATHVEFDRVPAAGHVFGGVDPLPYLKKAVEFLRRALD